MRTALLTSLLFCCPAFSQVFDVAESFDYSLAHRAQSSWTDGDLHVTTMAVTARFGVRRRSSLGTFQPREVAVLGESYELKDGAGESWVMTIHRADAAGLRVQLSRVTGRPDLPRLRFHVAEATANGAPVDLKLGDLELQPDGTYALGQVHGGYEANREGVALDGGRADWGRGTLSPTQDALTFKYQRGPISWEVKFARVDPAVTASR